MDNYRPISILPRASKILERAMHSQLYSFLTSNTLISIYKFGFRKRHYTFYKLQSHPNKTKMMVIGSRYNLNHKVSDLRSNIRINNNVVLSVFSQKCLGIYLDERLAFDAHIYLSTLYCVLSHDLFSVDPWE